MLIKIKPKRNYFLFIILLVFLFFMAWLLPGLNSDTMQLGSISEFNSGWLIEEFPDDNVVFFKRAVSGDMLGNTVCFFSYDSFVDAEIDGKSIYHFGEGHGYLRSPASIRHLIEIPADSLRGMLTIRIEYVYNTKFTSDIDFMLGSSGSVILELLRREAVDISINILVFVLGIILCIIFLLQLKNKMPNESSLYLGLLSLCFVFWTNNNLFATQFIFPYGAGQYFAYYFFLSMLPLLLMCYLETITEGLYFSHFYWIHISIVAVLTLLQLFGVAEFTETLTIFLAYAGGELLIVIIKLLRNKKSHRNRLLVGAFVIMIICILINAAAYFFSQTKGVSTNMAKLGISIYLLVSIYVSLGSIINDMAEARQSKALRKIAFTDSLTQVGNRYAFNFEINEISLNMLSLFSLDINNLKYYNDTFGHACGDTLICEATKMLSSIFDHLYRTGGDEFIAVKKSCSQDDLLLLKARLSETMRTYNDSNPDVLVEIACGYSSYREGDGSYEDILRRADAEMYKDKSKLKKMSKIKSIR